MPVTIGIGSPLAKKLVTVIAATPVTMCSVPISADAVPAISPCSSSASTEVVGMTRPRKP